MEPAMLHLHVSTVAQNGQNQTLFLKGGFHIFHKLQGHCNFSYMLEWGLIGEGYSAGGNLQSHH